MGVYLSVIAVTAVLFTLMVLQLAAKPRYLAKITGGMLGFAMVGGFVFYGFGFASVFENPLLATARAVLAVCGMFVGKNEFAAIEMAPGMDNPYISAVFWLVHLAALYTTASAAIAIIGAEALKKIRLIMTRRGDLTMIYGNHMDLVSFGKECSLEKGMSVVFVADHADAGFQMSVSGIGAALRTDIAALHPTKGFLRSLGIRKGKRKIYIYALDEDLNKNALFATELLQAFRALEISPSQLRVTLPGLEDVLVPKLQVFKEQYGYGFVTVFDRADFLARSMVHHCPPWERMEFDADGKATTDFETLIIGFGKRGQAALKALVMNGQFEGSHFRATVVEERKDGQSGFVRQDTPELFHQYDIEFIEGDARSKAVYEYIEEHLHSLKYIVICVADRQSSEISQDLMRFLEKRKVFIPVVSCCSDSVRYQASLKDIMQEWPLYSKNTLSTEIVDQMAMELNHRYSSNPEHTAWEDWAECDYFSRKSSRASADFMPAMIWASHGTVDQVRRGEWKLTDRMQETLGRTEHHRWCAFHYCMGFAAMTAEEYDAREKQYLDEKAQGKPTIRVGKNMVDKTHACLIPWEKLDALSERENRVTGKHLDYKRMDIDNVLDIAKLYRITDASEKDVK